MLSSHRSAAISPSTVLLYPTASVDHAGSRILALAEASPKPAASRVEDEALRLDGLAVSLNLAMDQATVPLARSARAFVRSEGWQTFGFARLSDYARERLGRSSRWVRDLAVLGDAIVRHRRLGEALSGEDGGPPLGRVPALLVARVSRVAHIAVWIPRARASSVRELRDAVRREMAKHSPAEPELGPDPADQVLVRLEVPAAVNAAFDEALDLFRAGEGGEAPVADFIEALTAETAAGAPLPPDDSGIEMLPLRKAPPRAQVEAAMADSTNRWSMLRRLVKDIRPAVRAIATLRQLDDVAARAGRGGPAELDSQLRELIALEDQLELRLGQLLAEMGARGVWGQLSFDGAGHYAEERLGLSRTSARSRVRAARGLGNLRCVRQAYEAGEVGLEAALQLVRIMDGVQADDAAQVRWIGRAREATVKRLKDEARELARARAQSPAESTASPLDDADWHRSVRREPGMARQRLQRLAAIGAQRPAADVFLRFRLDADLAHDFLAMIELKRRQIAGQCAPAWMGLLSMLEEFVEVWDGAPGRRGDSIYERDGYRCAAPGCTSRKNLEDHHVMYRSRGGSNAAANRLCLCRFHHQRGEHGGLASCRGDAPLGITWRLGRNDVATWYRNERRLV